MNLDRIGSHSPYYAVIARLDRGLAVITGLDPVIQTAPRRRPGNGRDIARNQRFDGLPGQARQ
jgi:hypothetical protein